MIFIDFSSICIHWSLLWYSRISFTIHGIFLQYSRIFSNTLRLQPLCILTMCPPTEKLYRGFVKYYEFCVVHNLKEAVQVRFVLQNFSLVFCHQCSCCLCFVFRERRKTFWNPTGGGEPPWGGLNIGPIVCLYWVQDSVTYISLPNTANTQQPLKWET